ncbi:MAG: hypothetical protein ABJD07_05385 [Gemmatimonadaceae bacterium]
MNSRFSLAAAALGAMMVVGAVPARGQITSVIAPPKQATKAAEREQRAQAHAPKRDTAVAVRMNNMRAWVDSASGVAVRTASTAAAPRDTTAVPATTARPVAPVVKEATTFHDGAPAPATASPLPATVIAGVLLLLAGVALARAPASDRARVRR